MSEIIAFCGLRCDQCGAYQATQAKDEQWLERVAAQWREEYKHPGITTAIIHCDGCLGVEGQKAFHCFECDIRACGLAHDVANCGACPEYESCDRIVRFMQFVPLARATLEGYRAGRSPSS